MALEPEWEAKFEPNSYGFRIGRSCHDAIGAIYLSICHQPKGLGDRYFKMLRSNRASTAVKET